MHTKVLAPEVQVKFDYKSRIFIMLFSDKKRLLKLYNAMSCKNYTGPELLIINTLENAIYMSMQNDLSFLIDLRLSLYEHQSTYNPNMPLRFLLYLSDLYSRLTKNILELVETCRDLQDYVEYTHRVRTYAEELPIEKAVEKAINECIQEGILKDFLETNRAEAMKMSIYEYHERKRAWEGTAFTQQAANEDRELCSRYNEQEHMTGKQVSDLFSRYRVWDYIYSCFEALHTTGSNYIVEDIDLYIIARQPASV